MFRQRQCRRRHYGGSHQPPVPAAGQRQADDHHAAWPASPPKSSISVVSVLCRMAFDFGLWSDGVSPLLFVCERGPSLRFPPTAATGFRPDAQGRFSRNRQGRPAKYGRVSRPRHPSAPPNSTPPIISQCKHAVYECALPTIATRRLLRSAVLGCRGKSAVVRPLARQPAEVLAFGEGGGAFRPGCASRKYQCNQLAAQRSHPFQRRRRSPAGPRYAFRQRRARALARKPPRIADVPNDPATTHGGKHRCCSRRSASIPDRFFAAEKTAALTDWRRSFSRARGHAGMLCANPTIDYGPRVNRITRCDPETSPMTQPIAKRFSDALHRSTAGRYPQTPARGAGRNPASFPTCFPDAGLPARRIPPRSSPLSRLPLMDKDGRPHQGRAPR